MVESRPWVHTLSMRFALLLPLVLSFASAPADCQAGSNVLVILADDLGVDYVTSYGEGTTPAPTPNIDALVANGVLFRNAWAYPSCSPARAAIMTGRHPFRTLVGRWIKHAGNQNPSIGTLRAEEWTLPEVLDLAGTGHAHACIGKWHVHDSTFPLTAPEDLGGFGTFTGFLAGQLPDYWSWPRVENGVEQTSSVYATTQQTDDAIAWIQGQATPWVCYMTYNAPHIPFHVPPPSLHPQTPNTGTNRDKYRAMIEAMDTEIGRLLANLPDPENTHVIFLGDNGSVQNMAVPPFDPSRAKGTPYEGGLNVPLVYKGPATVSPGREVTALATATDVFATVLELVGAGGALPPWVATDSVSFAPYLADPNQTPLRTFAYSEQFNGDEWPSPLQNGHATIRDERYKLIDRVSGTDEFFDLQVDPWENTNLLTVGLSFDEWLAFVALSDEINAMRSPLARVVPFGPPGCTGSAGVPAIGASGPPQLGTAFSVTLANAAPSTVALVLLGAQHDTWNGFDLPLDLVPMGGGPGCSLALAPAKILLEPVSAVGEASFQLPVPSDLSLMEATLLACWFVFDPGAPDNLMDLVNTQAIAAVVGY